MWGFLGRLIVKPLAHLGLKGARAISPRTGAVVGGEEGAAIAGWADDLVRAEAGGIKGFAEKMAQKLEGVVARFSTPKVTAGGAAAGGAGAAGTAAGGWGIGQGLKGGAKMLMGGLGKIFKWAAIAGIVLGGIYLITRMFSRDEEREEGPHPVSPLQPQENLLAPQVFVPAPAMGVPAGNMVTASYPAAVGYTDPQIAMAQPQTNWVARTGSAPVAARQGYTTALEQQPVAGTTQQGF